MIIAGLQKMTMLDYPGKLAAVVFTQGCNFACGYCHNSDMIPLKKEPYMSEVDFFMYLKKRIGFLDAVVVSGGEPTLQNDLIDFIVKIKNLGFLVKLDTNGSNPDVLKKLLDLKVLDYVAMDIKYSLSSYKKYCRYFDTDKLLASISILKNCYIEFEFRSTILPAHHTKNELEQMAQLVDGAQNWYLQRFRPNFTLDKRLSTAFVFTESEMLDLVMNYKKYANNVAARI